MVIPARDKGASNFGSGGGDREKLWTKKKFRR